MIKKKVVGINRGKVIVQNLLKLLLQSIMDASITGVGFGTNQCVVNPNSLKLQRGTGNYNMNTNNQCIVWHYTNTDMGWQIKSNSVS